MNFGGLTTGITYTTQLGNYTKIGRTVFIQAYVLLSSKGSATGSATVTGLPFASLTQAGNIQDVAVTTRGNITYTLVQQLICRLGSNSSTLNIDKIDSTGIQTQLTDTDFANNSNFVIQGYYIANS